MKKRIYCLFLLLAMLFIAGCNKKEEYPNPTPTVAATKDVTTPTSTPTPTPTPTPVNLAKTNLEKIPAAFDSMMSYQPENTVDLTNGVGYDFDLKLSLGSQIVELLELDGLEDISLKGTVDAKDSVAADLSLNLNTSEVVNACVFADSTNLFFNLPKYSANYAAMTWEELLESMDIDSEALSSLNIAETQASSEELVKKLGSHIEAIVACFQEVDGISKDVTIGTGDYTLTGEKHTVSAVKDELLAALKNLETELNNYYGEVDFDLDNLLPSDSTVFVLDYYVDANGNYAWVCYPDTSVEEPLIFINTSYGFCLYKVEDGEVSVGMNSVKSSETSGVINLLFDEDEEEPMGVVDYEYDDNSFTIDAVLDTIEMTLDGSKANDKFSYELTMVVDGMSIIVEQTSTKNHTELSCTLASYGVKYGTLTLTADIRDYAEISAPTNTTTLEAWTNGLDQNTLTTDLLALMQEYPFLMNLMGMSGEDDYDDTYDDGTDDDFWGDDTSRNDGGSYELPADYTDEFMGMTGYAVDEDGYVDFDPLEEEVIAAGKPSTGLDTLKLTDDQKQALFDVAEKSIPNSEKDIDSYYWVWGSTKYNDVQSYYSTEYDFDDPNNWDNNISFTFDAISGEFVSVDIYNTSKDEALRIANEIFTILGGTYTITAEMAEEYTYTDDGFAFSGYDAAQYGSNYYNVGISIYYSDWNW